MIFNYYNKYTQSYSIEHAIPNGSGNLGKELAINMQSLRDCLITSPLVA